MKINKIHNQQGFTLIELLVVITIIGILATVGVANFSGALSGSRDATRISNIKLFQTSLTSYYSDRGEYLSVVAAAGSTPLADFTTKIGRYIGSSYPKDSKSDQLACWKMNPAGVDAPAGTSATSATGTDGGEACGMYYWFGPSSTGMTNGGMKLGTTFEKEANVFGTKSQTRIDGGAHNGLYEVHDGGIGTTAKLDGTTSTVAGTVVKIQ